MSLFDTFVSTVSERTWLRPSVARSAASGLLVSVMENAPTGDAEVMLDLIPGTETAVRSYFGTPDRERPAVAKGLGNFRHPRPEQVPSVFDFLDGFGVSHDRSGSLISSFLEFLDACVGPKVARGVARRFVL